jgi:hypothetical protein
MRRDEWWIILSFTFAENILICNYQKAGRQRDCVLNFYFGGGIRMNWKEKLKIGVWGAIGGAIVLGIIGFRFGGWVTGGTAQVMAKEMAEKAVIDRLAPMSIALFMQDPNREERLKELIKAASWARGDYVKKHGWATMPGEKEPDSQVADEVARRLVELKK